MCFFNIQWNAIGQYYLTSVCISGKCLVTMYYNGKDCAKCPKGRFGEAPNLQSENQCRSCQKGTYGNTSGLSKCHDCPVGHFAPDEERTTCETCAPGRYQPANGGSLCYSCEQGTNYQNAFGQSTCKLTQDCKAGEFTAKPSNSTTPPVCELCPSGRFREIAATSSLVSEVANTVCAEAGFIFKTKEDGTGKDFHPLFVAFIIILVIAALIYPIYKFVQLIIWIRSLCQRLGNQPRTRPITRCSNFLRLLLRVIKFDRIWTHSGASTF